MSSRKGWHLIFVMENKICSFFGHRDAVISDELYAIAKAEIERSVDFGCRIFYFGEYGTFDCMCYKIVTQIQEDRRELEIKRVYCVAREEYLRKKVRYFNKEDYDEVIYLEPSFDGWYKSIYYRNCAMIDRSDYIIFFAEEREGSGAYKALKYAKRKKKKIVNLWKTACTSTA